MNYLNSSARKNVDTFILIQNCTAGVLIRPKMQRLCIFEASEDCREEKEMCFDGAGQVPFQGQNIGVIGVATQR